MPDDQIRTTDGMRQAGIDGVIAEGETLLKLTGGFTFTEGPIWDPDTDTLFFSDIAESRQYSLRDGTLKSLRHPSNQANGNCFDLEGRVVSCEHASSQLVVHDHGGKRVRVLASHFDGKELNSPNDVVCDSKGRLWFTDPSFGRLRKDLGILREQELDFQGVFRLDPDGRLTVVVSDFKQPHGLCFSNDEAQLFINDSWGPHVRVFDVAENGSLSGGKVWAEITGEGEGVPDGMKVDLEGRLYCNGPGGVHVYSPDAKKLGVIQTPEKSTNFCFSTDGRPFITACTSVYVIQTNARAASMKHRA